MIEAMKMALRSLCRSFEVHTQSRSFQMLSSAWNGLYLPEQTVPNSEYSKTVSMEPQEMQESSSTTNKQEECRLLKYYHLSTLPISNVVLIIDDSPEGEILKSIRNYVLQDTDYHQHLPLLEAQYHQAVLVSYEVHKFPTILLLDKYNQEVFRLEGTACLNADRLISIVHHLEYNCDPDF